MTTIYLAGEIHSNWRDSIIQESKNNNLNYKFLSPQLDHMTSDNIGKKILGEQPNSFYNDNVSAKINTIQTHLSIQRSDIIVVKFGEQYKQWNAAFDTGYAAALGKKIIIIHPSNLNHPLKEIDSIACVTVENENQVIKILEYIEL